MEFLPANAAHWHLILNHLPVVGSIGALLLTAWALIRNSEELKRAALGAVVLVAISAIPAYLTGDPAEHDVNGLAGVSERWISNHEEVAQVALWAALIVGAAALGVLAFFRKTRPIPRWAMILVLVLQLVVCGLMGLTANYGGRIHHPEIRTYPTPESPSADADR
jgi:hypothetical protein